MRKGQKENIVLSECLQYLSATGIFHWRNNTGAVKVGSRFVKFGYKGSSDIIGICPDGRFLAIECKREFKGKLSEHQKVFLTQIEKNGGVAIVTNSLVSMIEQLKAKNII